MASLVNQALLDKLKTSAHQTMHRLMDQHITLGVTGLSRSGKTAFITSLINQLVNQGHGVELTFFDPVHEQRFIAAKRLPQQHLHIPRFDYDQAIAALSAQQPHWPEPTKGISEIRLAIRYQPQSSLLKYTGDMATLLLDITDYPGEWLLDLPMMNQSFEQWSKQMTALLEHPARQPHAKAFLAKVQSFDPFAPLDEQQLKEIACCYTQLLHQLRNEQGLSLVQPGRFILPGELENAPILEFFPIVNFTDIDANQYQNATDDSMIGMLRARFIEYKSRVITPFYQQHFSRFDRQIVLADCLSALNAGIDGFTDLQQALELIMHNFAYGQSSWLSRLFAPKIDKILFAATKADHVTLEQQTNLASLMHQLMHSVKQKVRFDKVTTQTLAISSIAVTEQGKSLYQGQQVPVVRGKPNNNQQIVTMFPGSVPNKLPDAEFFQQHQFNFTAFDPMKPFASTQALPQQRLDQVLQFLLADKMK